jgi:photosystem II stability/assembly factor-like uncharacterized protein
MSKGAELTPQEEEQLATFLNGYTRNRRAGNGADILPVSTPHQEGLYAVHLAIDPKEPQVMYVATRFSIGVLKSADGGQHWTQINGGFKSFSSTQIVIDPTHPDHLYVGDGCAGLYVSHDGGRSWKERNDGLQNTEIGAVVLHPTEPGSAYVVTTRGVYKMEGDGRRWIPFNQGDDFTDGLEFPSLLILPTTPPTFYLASRRGLHTRREGDAGWLPVRGIMEDKQISALARDPKTGRLYAGVFRRGATVETLREGGLFVSEDEGKSWARLGTGLEGDRIRVILPDPSDPRMIYVTSSGRGVLKSADGGRSWKEINIGLTDPERDIRALIMDPHDAQHLYAGSHGDWIYQSRDAGATWMRLPLGPHQTVQDIQAALDQEDELARRTATVHPPAAFGKCTNCHGWTDPYINKSKGSWRVATNRRNWTLTVKRMSKGAGLTPAEEVEIAGFLNAYTQGKQPAER